MNETQERVNVLLVEDDLAHSKIMRRALRGASSRINLYHVTDGHGAMNFLRGGTSAGVEEAVSADLVLLDLRMPTMDGFAVLSAVKCDAALRELPVVVISTSDRPDDVKRCYSLGANAYVTKPVDYREFSRCVESIASFWLDCATLPPAAARVGNRT